MTSSWYLRLTKSAFIHKLLPSLKWFLNFAQSTRNQCFVPCKFAVLDERDFARFESWKSSGRISYIATAHTSRQLISKALVILMVLITDSRCKPNHRVWLAYTSFHDSVLEVKTCWIFLVREFDIRIIRDKKPALGSVVTHRMVYGCYFMPGT